MTMLGACGLDCAACEAYQATQANDLLMLESVAEKWTKEYNARGITAENILCDGCMTEGRKIGHCLECKMRLCAIGRVLPHCAACADYPCQDLTAFFQAVPTAKMTLDVLRA